MTKIPTKPSISYVKLPNSQENEKYDPKSFVLDWLREPTKDINKEIQTLAKQIKAKERESPIGENFLALKEQKQLLEDVYTVILGKPKQNSEQESEQKYNSALIRLELVTRLSPSELEKIATTPPLQEYTFV